MSRRLHDVFKTWIGGVAAIFASTIILGQLWAQKLNEISDSRGIAGYLVAFAQFAKWRETDFTEKDTVTLVILGENPFEKEMEYIESKKVRSESGTLRKIKVRVFKNLNDVPACQILFVSQSEKRDFPKVLRPFRDRRILTVSVMDEFIQEGGIASVVIKQTKLSFNEPIPYINEEAAARVGLEFQSELRATVKLAQEKLNK